MKAQELRKLTEGELATRMDEAYEELMNLRFNVAIGQQRDTNTMTEIKRDIARMQTIQRERQLATEMS